MKPIERFVLIIVAVLAPVALAQTPLGSAFTYQGQLKENAQPFNDSANLVFRLFDVPTGGIPLGSQVLPMTSVTNGLFTVELNGGDEFGATTFNGQERWLEVEVSGTPLSPRQRLTAASYALHALSSSGACVPTIADLKGLTPPPTGVTHCRRLLGYYAPGDGGGGEFYWDASSTGPDDNGMVIRPSSMPAAGRWKRLTEGKGVSVKWFGATGNDTTDDTAAFHAAISAARGTRCNDTGFPCNIYAALDGCAPTGSCVATPGRCTNSNLPCNAYSETDTCLPKDTCIHAGEPLDIPAGPYVIDTIDPIFDDMQIRGRCATALEQWF